MDSYVIIEYNEKHQSTKCIHYLSKYAFLNIYIYIYIYIYIFLYIYHNVVVLTV